VVLAVLVTQASSCVPLLIGGVVGYVARDKGLGRVDGGGDTAAGYDTTPAYGDGADYDFSGSEYTDEPVY
jgi:hypothetical protein